MNNLSICDENGEIINNQIEACNTAISFYEMVSKKGPREFLTEMGKLNIKAKIKEMELREISIENNTKQNIAQIKANATNSNEIIKAQKAVRLAEIKTEQIRITEQSKCLQKMIEVAQKVYNKKIDFYKAQLKSCENFFQPQIQMINESIKLLNEEKIKSFDADLKTKTALGEQLNLLLKSQADVNLKYGIIMNNLTEAVELAKLEVKSSTGGYLN